MWCENRAFMLSLITHWCPDLSSLAYHLLFRSGHHPAVNLGIDDVPSKITACAPARAWRSQEPKESCAASSPSCRTNSKRSCAACTTPATIPSAIWPRFFRSPGQPSTERSTVKSPPFSDQKTAPLIDQSHKSRPKRCCKRFEFRCAGRNRQRVGGASPLQ